MKIFLAPLGYCAALVIGCERATGASSSTAESLVERSHVAQTRKPGKPPKLARLSSCNWVCASGCKQYFDSNSQCDNWLVPVSHQLTETLFK